MQMLSALAINFDLAVLVTNQIYASFDEESEEDFSPVGGTIIQYRSKIIIELKREEGTNQRIAVLKRHKTKREGLAVHFVITNNGIEWFFINGIEYQFPIFLYYFFSLMELNINSLSFFITFFILFINF